MIHARKVHPLGRGRGDHPRDPDGSVTRSGVRRRFRRYRGRRHTCLDAITYELVVSDWVLPDGDGTEIADTAANRMWEHFFGVGLVDPVDDFREENPASPPTGVS